MEGTVVNRAESCKGAGGGALLRLIRSGELACVEESSPLD